MACSSGDPQWALPIVSIVVPLSGLTLIIIRILDSRTETIGRA